MNQHGLTRSNFKIDTERWTLINAISQSAGSKRQDGILTARYLLSEIVTGAKML